MKLGVLTVPLGGMSLDEACGFLAGNGVQMVEIGCGGFPGKAHCDPEVLLADEAKLNEFKATFEKYGLKIDPDAMIEDISVGMQQRVEILKMLYRENEILIFDEPTAVLTPQEIDELMEIMRNFTKEGKSILFITHTAPITGA